jgi:hypothetical protein
MYSVFQLGIFKPWNSRETLLAQARLSNLQVVNMHENQVINYILIIWPRVKHGGSLYSFSKTLNWRKKNRLSIGNFNFKLRIWTPYRKTHKEIGLCLRAAKIEKLARLPKFRLFRRSDLKILFWK